jgi:MFS family permease
MPRALKALLESANMRRYLLAMTLSTFGDTAMLVVSAIWVKQLTGSNSAAVLVQLCIWVPNFAAPFLGALVDRLPRRMLLVWSNLAMGVLLLALFAVRGPGEVWLIFAVMLLYGVNYVLSGAAEPAMLTLLVPAERLGDLNGLRTSLAESCKLVAPALGAGIFTWYGAHWVVALDSATFALAALLVFRIRVAEPPRRDSAVTKGAATPYSVHPAEGEGRPALRDGLLRVPRRAREHLAVSVRHLGADPDLRVMIPVIGLSMLVLNLRQTFAFAVIEEALHRPPAFAGIMGAVQGVGSIVAGLAAGPLLRGLGERGTAALGGLVGSAASAVTLIPHEATVLSGSLLWGIGIPWMLIAGMTLLQLRAPEDAKGRVIATGATVMYSPLGIGMPIGAALMAWTDYRITLAAAVPAGLLLAAVLLRRTPRAGADPATLG